MAKVDGLCQCSLIRYLDPFFYCFKHTMSWAYIFDQFQLDLLSGVKVVKDEDFFLKLYGV